ncbi:phosphotransferase [Nocardioides sp. zg-536]|uniref:Phosphotransferase n=1 Tax=Nocardioides faecalis TaxID=2803858 RepID=A0A938Y682_9ACTN|nr:phosphotransferase [Nocardioides faecalis]MBM9458978.1 phosphotransferase [Nocardioides faecalis]QVI60371.1 phosphotransferase [Nocardioides faecalis]
MWQPEPDWVALPGGTGTVTVGLWRTALGGRPVVVKRLRAPEPDDPPGLADPGHVGYWRREADVLLAGLTATTPGLRATTAAVEEDAEGVTIVRDWVEESASSGLFLALSLGRFAGADLPGAPFLADHLLADRLARTARRGGWPTLARTAVADVADHLWSRRVVLLGLIDTLPQVPQHGDPTAANLPGRDGDDVVAIDWGTLGRGPVGGDLGYLSLSSREEFEPLLDAYLLGLPDGLADTEQVLLGARVVAVYTALSRAEWALARVAGGEGALAGKYRHPAVAPYLRALQRTFVHMEALLAR